MARKILMFCLGLLLALTLVCTALALPANGPVVSDPKDQVNPSISGSTIVWQDYRNKLFGCPTYQDCIGADVYSKDLTTGVEQLLTPTAANTSADMDPDISGNLVVWRNWETGRIVVHNLTSGAEQNTSTMAGQETVPAISGNKVVWVDYTASPQYGDIYMRDLGQPAEAPVSLGSSLGATAPDYKKDKKNPDIDGNIVVWIDWRNATQDATGWVKNPDIYMKDLSTGVEQPVCTDPGDQYYPVVSGNRVLWQDTRNGNWDVYMKDLSTGVESRLSTSSEDQTWPSISGNTVVWKNQGRTGAKTEDIQSYDLTTGVVTSITADPESQKTPVINGSTIAWADKRAGNWNINITDSVAPQILAPGPSGWTNSSSAVLSASYADTVTGINQASVVVTVDMAGVAGCTVTATQVSCPVTGLADGPHVVRFGVSDNAGNTATADVTISVDTAAPAIAPFGPSGWLTSGSVLLSAGYSDIGIGMDLSTVVVMVDGIPDAGCTAGAISVSCPALTLADGHHTVTLDAQDLLGNPAVQGQTAFDIDTANPVLGTPVIDVPAGTDSATISAAINDAGIGVEPSSVHLLVDGVQPASCTLNTDPATCALTGLALGSHTVDFSAADKLGHTASTSASFQITDTVKPVISNTVPVGSLATAATTIGASFSDAVPSSGINTLSVAVTLDTLPVAGCTVTTAGVSCPVNNLANGTHQVAVQVGDAAGNSTSNSWSFAVAAPGPIISNMLPLPGALVNNGWPAISADLADNGRGVNPSSAHIYLDGTEMTPTATAAHISGLVSSATSTRLTDGVHTVNLAVADNQGVVSTQTWTFTVTSPSLHLFANNTYWQSYAAYQQHLLSVDYQMSNPGLGACNYGEVPQAIATSGVIAMGPVPLSMGTLAGGSSYPFTMQYLVPPGVSRFYATTYAYCEDDGGDQFWFPGPVPFQ